MRSPQTIWLINPYGPIPGEGWRDYRFTMLGEALAARGHNVVWWTSSFAHHFKKQRCTSWEDRTITERFILRLVPSPAYQKNVGLKRVWRDLVYGWRTYRRGLREQRPDLVFFSESPLTFGFAGYRLGRKLGAKMIFDQMDLWPEIIERALPASALFFCRPLLAAVYRFRRLSYERLHGSCALATPYLQMMHQIAPDLRNRPSCVAYNGIDVLNFRNLMKRASSAESQPLKLPGQIWAIFAGSLGETYDIRTILKASGLLRERGAKIIILIAGDGPLRDDVAKYASNSTGSQIIYFGKLNQEQLAGVYSRCDIGLCAYSAGSNVEMPDKIYDYTAAGLAVLNSLTGEVSQFVQENQIGLQYQAGNVDDLVSQLMRLDSNRLQLDACRARAHNLGATFDKTAQLKKIDHLVDRVLSSEVPSLL